VPSVTSAADVRTAGISDRIASATADALTAPGLAQPHEYHGFDACIVVVVRFYNALNDSVQVAGQTQRQAKAGVVVMAKLVFPNITAGVAIAGVRIWLATAHGVAAIAAPPIQLASMDAVLAPPLGPAINPACGGFAERSTTPTGIRLPAGHLRPSAVGSIRSR
jgi:hypothetical protein